MKKLVLCYDNPSHNYPQIICSVSESDRVKYPQNVGRETSLFVCESVEEQDPEWCLDEYTYRNCWTGDIFTMKGYVKTLQERHLDAIERSKA